MNSNLVNQEKSKRTSVKFSFKSILMLMATIMMALVTLTSCDEDKDPSDDPDEIENGGNGGVAGKRLKSTVQTSGTLDLFGMEEYTYNSDGTLKRRDYDTGYTIYTNNADGTLAKLEAYYKSENGKFDLIYEWNFSHDTNKKPITMSGTYYNNGTPFSNMNWDFTYQNGRKTGIKETDGTIINVYEYSYDSQGRLTQTSETTYYNEKFVHSRTFNYTYNSDGTLQKVVYPSLDENPTTITKEFTWENGKSTYNFIPDYALW